MMVFGYDYRWSRFHPMGLTTICHSSLMYDTALVTIFSMIILRLYHRCMKLYMKLYRYTLSVRYYTYIWIYTIYIYIYFHFRKRHIHHAYIYMYIFISISTYETHPWSFSCFQVWAAKCCGRPAESQAPGPTAARRWATAWRLGMEDPGTPEVSGFIYIVYMYISYTGWWFGTWPLFSHILGMSSSQLTDIFQRKWNHQPV